MNKTKLLLVEDDSINAIVMQHYFEHVYDFYHVADGHQVIEFLRQNTIDVVIMDINLSKDDIDGVTLIEEIRKDEQLKHITVFALTGYAMHSDGDMFLAKGFNKYIPKPVDFQLVSEAIASVLAEK